MSLSYLLAGLTRMALLAGAAGALPRTDGPVRVFVLAGQSNMQGTGQIHADTDRNGGRGSLEHLVGNPATASEFGHLVDAEGHWVVRDDVWIWSLGRHAG